MRNESKIIARKKNNMFIVYESDSEGQDTEMASFSKVEYGNIQSVNEEKSLILFYLHPKADKSYHKQPPCFLVYDYFQNKAILKLSMSQ